jgi:hypothetical protein
MADPKSLKDAAETVSSFARSGLEKARRGDLDSISEAELASFEAVVRADGSRPTLLLRDGQVPLDHPMISDWRDVIGPIQPTSRESARSFYGVLTRRALSNRTFAFALVACCAAASAASVDGPERPVVASKTREGGVSPLILSSFTAYVTSN